MQPDETTQAIESTDENRAKADPSPSRRGFLKKTAAAGILGTTGIAVATGTASAQDAGTLTVRADGTGDWHYKIYVYGQFTSGADAGDVINPGYRANGNIYGGNYDTYTHTGSIERVEVYRRGTRLILFYNYPGWNRIDVEIPETDVYHHWNYYIRATGNMSLTGNCEPTGGAHGEDDDNGDRVHGDIIDGGTDTYSYTGAIDVIRAGNNTNRIVFY